jgi:hypothetical protein
MKEITKEYAKSHNLKKIGIVRDDDMSKIILKLERLKENKNIKYYCIDLIVFDSEKHLSDIQASIWKD